VDKEVQNEDNEDKGRHLVWGFDRGVVVVVSWLETKFLVMFQKSFVIAKIYSTWHPAMFRLIIMMAFMYMSFQNHSREHKYLKRLT